MKIPIIDTKNVNTLQEPYNRKRYPEFCKYLDEHYPEDLQFKEKLYWYFHDLDSHPVCKICGKPTRFITYGEGYKEYCSSACASRSENSKEKRKKTCLEKYGVDNASKSPIILQKIRNSNMERYGVEYHSQLESAKEQTKQTCLERYGGNAPRSSKKVQEKSKQTCLERYGNENYNNREKSIQTCLDKYGVENPMQNPEIKQKSNNTCLERYGEIYVMKNEDIKSKSKQTKLERYGDPFFTNPEKIKQTKLERYGDEYYVNREKAQQTILEKYGVDHYMKLDKIKQKFIGNVKSSTLNKYKEIISWNDDEYICSCPHPECSKCKEKQYRIPKGIFLNRKYQNIETCTTLVPLDRHNKNTSLEIFIQNILNKYNINYETGNRKILNGKELDIYIPDLNIAIECNGILWHSQYTDKNQNYHFEKWNQCMIQGIQLITFWEDQIINNPDMVESILLSKLGIYQTRIGASKCKVGSVPKKIAREFLLENHLQGPVNSLICLGLYYKGDLVSLMTFGKKRRSLGNTNDSADDYELYRYCTKKNWQVIGGTDRLMSHFIKEFNPSRIISFSSNDISMGKLYENLGFQKSGYNISYWYIDKKMNRYHRYKYRKSELIKMGYDPKKTEFEITLGEIGLYRIYDSGQTKWTKSCL